ncbi:MAG: hypothetical protein OXC71_07615 [Chloroflexi bacterium]|nr:hypothetical protein [Chloroflexota bacterium]
MKARTTKTRTALAVAILAALPIFTGAVQSDADPATTDAAHTSRGAERGSGPRWSFILGEDGGDRTGCWGIGGWAEVWCRVYAL